MTKPVRSIKWGAEKRLEFIDFRLFWEGAINRADIMEQFGVSVPQASKDLSLYQEQAPANIVYDKSEKRYFVSSEFKPTFFQPDADAYLSQLKSIAEKSLKPEETWLSDIPAYDSMPIPHRQVDPVILQKIIAAIRSGSAIEIKYQSMSKDKPKPMLRWITPHAFGNDGFRWHVRAYCSIDGRFKDFLLSRILEIKDMKPAEIQGKEDKEWHEVFEVTLIPNPALSEEQRKMIAQDYGMKKGEITIQVRCSILYYFKKRLRLDVAEALDEPREAPVVIKNRDEFEKALSRKAS
jgi:predicted DNA-binding transcriptional regulator YafY